MLLNVNFPGIGGNVVCMSFRSTCSVVLLESAAAC